jgi:O-antigen/teichoic acid export membrane protein
MCKVHDTALGDNKGLTPAALPEARAQSELRALKSRPRVHSFVWDVAVTTAASVLMMVEGVLSVSLVGRWLGALAVGEYLLISRVASWLSSGVQLGIGVALPRYVARVVNHRTSDQLGYLTSGLVCLVGTASVVGSLLLLAPGMFARWLFGSLQMVHLVTALALMLLGQAVHTAVYGYYRGNLWMQWANALQVVNMVLLPIAAIIVLYYRHGSVAAIVSVTGAAVTVSSVLFLIPAVRGFHYSDLHDIRPPLLELLRYGVARVPGEFAGSALFALGPVIASHYLPISDVSDLLLGLGMLMAVAASVTPCGTVLLSKVSMMLARGQIHEVRSRLEQFVGGVLELSVFACLQAVVLADVIVRAWVGAGYLGGIGVIRVTLLSIPFYLYFIATRSAIDAASVVAHNAHNGYIALAVFLGLIAGAVLLLPRSYLLIGIAGALMVANAVLAWRTSAVARQVLDLRIPWRRCALPLGLAMMLGLASYGVRLEAGSHFGLAAAVLLGLSMSAAFLLIAPQVGSTWLVDSRKLLMAGRVGAEAKRSSSAAALDSNER